MAQGVCAKLGETLWKPKSGHKRRAAAALPFSEYLKYEGTCDASTRFWTSSDSAVDLTGRFNNVSPASHDRYPGLCTNTAPYSTGTTQDASSKWQISLDVNNQTLTG